MSGYILGEKSVKKLSGVNKKLVDVVKLAITLSKVDFTVVDGLRTLEQQQAAFRTGKSLMDGLVKKSKHQRGLAVDLAGWVEEKINYNYDESIYAIATAMRDAAIKLNVKLIWGGVWDRKLNDIKDVKKEIKEYTSRLKKKAFLDGTHFEIA